MLGKTVILGDSYSAFDGYIPKGYHSWYTTVSPEATDVNDAKQTWWYKVFDGKDNILRRNESFSGTSICNTVRPQLSVETSFISRFDKLVSDGFFENNTPDTLLVFGGTNDCWIEVPIGKPQYENFTKDDLKSFLPAVSYLASRIKEVLPKTRVYWLINTDLTDEISNGIADAAKRFGQNCIVFKEIDKHYGHPTVKGMEQIAEVIKSI